MSEARQPHASPYRVLADTAEDHIFVINRDDRIEYVNPAAARQLGTVPDRLVGRRRAELFPPDVAERQGRNLTRVISTGTPLYVEGRTMYGDREVWLSTWLTPVHSHAGDVTAVLGVSRDITVRKRLEDELRAADQRRRVVWANVLFMSGYPSSLVLANGHVDRSVNLLSKPFTTTQLIAAVRAALTAQT